MSLRVDADFSEVAGALGALRGMTVAVRTPAYINSVLTLAHDRMAKAFDNEMDLVSEEGRSQSLQHVYDWSQNAAPLKLWKHSLKGYGATKEASFDFLPSVRNIPTPMERMGRDSNDAIKLVPMQEIAKLSQRNYIFRWKAPIMEYNTPVNIVVKHAKALFIPTGIVSKPFKFATSQRINSPGGNVSTGRFTSFWVSWWSTNADIVFEEKVRNIIENDLANIPIGSRKRAKTATIMTRAGKAGFDTYMKIGEAETLKYMENRSAGYKRMSRTSARSYE